MTSKERKRFNKIVPIKTQIRLYNIAHLNLGGISLAFHNKFVPWVGKCTKIANKCADREMYDSYLTGAIYN